MDILAIFLVQFALSFVVYGLMWKWFLASYYRSRPVEQGLTILLLPHLWHHIGLTTLVPTVVAKTMPGEFAVPVSIGDVVIIVLALASLGMLRYRARGAAALIWAFSIVGSLYMIYTGILWVRFKIWDHLAAHCYVGSFYIPLLVTSHILIIWILLARGAELGVYPNKGT